MQINKYFSCVGSQDVYSGSSYSYTITHTDTKDLLCIIIFN